MATRRKRQQLTPEKVREYIDGYGGACPYCGASEVEGDSFDYESGTVWQYVTCLNCQASWQDVYEMSYVCERDEKGDWTPVMPSAVKTEGADA